MSELCAVGSDQNLAVLLEHILEVFLNRVSKAHDLPPEVAGGNIAMKWIRTLLARAPVGIALEVWVL